MTPVSSEIDAKRLNFIIVSKVTPKSTYQGNCLHINYKKISKNSRNKINEHQEKFTSIISIVKDTAIIILG